MKKTLVALAALAATSAFAQSSVEIYGTLDVGNWKVSGQQAGLNNVNAAIPASQSATALLNAFARAGTSTNNMGFRGREDLGGGMYAGFDLQTGGLDMTDGGAGLAFSRESHLKLGSKAMGDFKIGRTVSTACAIGCSYSYNFIGAGSAEALIGLSPANFAGSSRRSNLIEWTSPTMSGFQAKFGYRQKGDLNADATYATSSGTAHSGTSSKSGSSTTAANFDATTAIGFSYANGPLRAAYVQETAPNDALNTRTSKWMGVEYNFGFVKANIQTAVNPNKGGSAAPTSASDSTAKDYTGLYGLSTAAGVTTYGKGTTIAVVAPISSALNIGFQSANNTEQKIKANELFAQYALSKRTTLFASTTSLSGAKAVAAGTSFPSTADNKLTNSALPKDPTITGLGIRHTF
jgi:predicted porin